MQQVRTHFSTAYELPLLTRAENYAQVSPCPQLPALGPLGGTPSLERELGALSPRFRPVPGVHLCLQDVGGPEFSLPPISVDPGLAGLQGRGDWGRSLRMTFPSATLVTGIGTEEC